MGSQVTGGLDIRKNPAKKPTQPAFSWSVQRFLGQLSFLGKTVHPQKNPKQSMYGNGIFNILFIYVGLIFWKM